MKFNNLLTIFSLTVIIIKLVKSSRLNNKVTQSEETNFNYNNLINRGYSFLLDNIDILNNPTTMIAPNNIFSYSINLKKLISDENYKVPGLKYDSKKENEKKSVYIKDYNFTEIADAAALTVNSTDQPVLNNDFFIKRAKSIKDLQDKNTIIYTNELKKAVIQINLEDGKFPQLNDKFLTDTIKIFGTEEIINFCENRERLNLAYDYLRAYGTSFITKIKFGCKATFIGEFLKPKFPDGTLKETEAVVITAGKLEYDFKIREAKRVDNENEIMIKNGHCTYDAGKNAFIDEDDNYSTMSVIGINTKSLHELFGTSINTKNLETKSGVKMTESVKNMIYSNMKKFIFGLSAAMDVRNAPISDLSILNNLNANDLSTNPCLKPRKKLWKNKNGSVFGEHFKSDVDMPIYGFVQDTNKVKYKDIIMSSGTNADSSQATYGCLKKSPDFNPEIVSKLNKHKRTFIKKIYFKTMDKLEKGEEKNCTIFWTKAPKEVENPENIIHSYICVQKTSCPFDDYITDFKMIKFSGGKCENSLSYLGRNYNCICDYNLLKAANAVASDGKYLCYSMKIKAKK